MERYKPYEFHCPNFDKLTYIKLKELTNDGQISQHRALTLAIWLLHDAYNKKSPDLDRVLVEERRREDAAIAEGQIKARRTLLT